jgi:hypothetical protein
VIEHPIAKAVECLYTWQSKLAKTGSTCFKAHIDMLILQTLQWGPLHGLAIAQTIRDECPKIS